MIVAGFDLSKVATGAAVLDGTKVIVAEAHKCLGDNPRRVFGGFSAWCRDFLIKHDVKHAAIEQPLRTPMINPKTGELEPKSNMDTYCWLYGLRAVTYSVCGELDIPCVEVNMMTWRKAFTGNARSSKENTAKLAKPLLPSLTSLDAAEAIGVAWWLQGHLSPLGQLGMRGAA